MDMRKNPGKEFEHGEAVAMRGNADGTKIVIRHAAGKRRRRGTNGGMAPRDVEAHPLLGSFEAIGAALAGHITGVLLVLRIQRSEAGEALVGGGLVQRWVHADALIEDKAFALVMRAAAFLEIFEDAAVELEDILKT